MARVAIEAVRENSGALDVQQPLRDLGVSRDMLPSIAQGAVAHAVTRNPPRRPTAEEVRGILDAIF
jgi:alcohol dehydrogenase class IV